jgi:hypothetical protein
MIPKINIQNLFFNRRQTEIGDFFVELNKYEEASFDEQDAEKRGAIEDRIQSYFPPSARERDIWNLIEREGSLTRMFNGWRTDGSSIFAFRDDLLQMFLRSDVQDMPINAIQFPYDSLYLYFGDADLFPDFSDEYRIDGLLISADSLCRQFKHGKVESLQVITETIQDGRKLHQRFVDFWKKQEGARSS